MDSAWVMTYLARLLKSQEDQLLRGLGAVDRLDSEVEVTVWPLTWPFMCPLGLSLTFSIGLPSSATAMTARYSGREQRSPGATERTTAALPMGWGGAAGGGVEGRE